MPNSDKEHKTVELLTHINAAITNVRLYPPKSALIASSMERLNATFNSLLNETPAINYAESEKKLLIQGEPLPEKSQRRPQVQAFLAILQALGIKSISFEQGLTNAEINDFLQLLGNPPDDYAGAGELQELMAQKAINHIRIDEKIYVAQGADQSSATGINLSDEEEILRAVFGEQSVSAEARVKLREMADNPGWISNVFQAGVRHVMGSAEADAGEAQARQLALLIDRLADLSGLDRQEVLLKLFDSTAQIDDGLLFAVLALTLDSVSDRNKFKDLANTLGEDQFKQVYGRVAAAPADAGAPLERLLELLRGTDKAKALGFLSEQPPDGAAHTSKMDSAESLEQFKTSFNRLLNGDVTVLPQVAVMSEMPRAVESLVAKGRSVMLNAMCNHLVRGLQSKNPKIKESAADVAAALDVSLAAAGRLNERFEFSKKLVAWAGREKEMSNALETVSRRLGAISEALICDDRLQDAAPILEAYQLLQAGDPSKDEAIQALATNLLQNLVTDDVFNVILREKMSETSIISEDDVYSLVILGTPTVERLLDRLYESHNRSERNRIVQIVTRIGAPARQPLLERLSQGGPWFYIRNLIMLLGRVGEQQHMAALERFLNDPDFRVQREAVLAIQNIGGQSAGDLLLNRLDEVADEIKCVIVSVLGMMNYQKALPYLIMKLENRDLGGTREATTEINVKICEALGRMGDGRARPLLEQIVRSRKFLGGRSHDQKVKTAAARALAAFEQS